MILIIVFQWWEVNNVSLVGKMSFKGLAEKIFKLFDKTGDGKVGQSDLYSIIPIRMLLHFI